MSGHDIYTWDLDGLRLADQSRYWYCATCDEWFRSKSNYAMGQEQAEHREGRYAGMPLGS